MAEQITFDKFIQEFASQELKKQIVKYEQAGKRAMKEIRENIVNAWFGEFNSSSVNFATMYNVYSRYFNNGEAKIYINSYVDVDAYKDKPSASRWIRKHSDVAKTDPKEYVLNLQMIEGIIGLPERANFAPGFTQSNSKGDLIWDNGVNQHFHKRARGLQEEIYESDLWKNFNDKVNAFAK